MRSGLQGDTRICFRLLREHKGHLPCSTQLDVSFILFYCIVISNKPHPYPNFNFPPTRSQIETLLHKVNFLLDFVELYSGRESKETKHLEQHITHAACAAEDIIESYIVKQIHARDTDHGAFFEDMQRSIHEMDVIREEVMKIQEKKLEEGQQQLVVKCSGGSLETYSGKGSAVGFAEDVGALMEQPFVDTKSRIIIPIVGMGGIGKTTLARNVFELPVVLQNFDVSSWVTISQDYHVGEIILSLLRGIGVVGNGTDVADLGLQLHQTLIGRRYLIVLDDLWGSEAWEKIMLFIPDNNNGSRILFTTRLSDVASSIGTYSAYQMKLLDDNKSWDLFSRKAFGEEACLPELEKLGKGIAKSCKGLPLAIVVIGGLLKMSPRTHQYWEYVAGNVNSIVNTANDEHCLKILSLSYTHLPVHLKPCFLYMATFREDYEIRVAELIRLWVSDGFLKPTAEKNLEEVAMEYLIDLVGRNLIMVLTRSSSGRIKSCILHDLLRDLCLREALKERFLCVVEEGIIGFPQRMENERRLVMNQSSATAKSVTELSIPSQSSARSFVSNFWHIPQSSFCCSLLRVLHTRDRYNPAAVLQLVNLRYLEFSVQWQVQSQYFSSLSLLWNLETLVVDGISMEHEVILPCGIWKLQYLRHLIINDKVILADPPAECTDLVLNNLQTLAKIEDFGCSTEVLKRMPILNSLEIYYDMNKESRGVNVSSCFRNLVHCDKLETLACEFTPKKNDVVDGAGYKCVFSKPGTLRFSHGLRKLTLRGSNIPWENMPIVGSLPMLEILKLQPGAFCGRKWKSREGDFKCLKYLSIRACYLSTWKAEYSHFPRLECLVLRNMVLEEIPWGIGEVATLELIRLDHCWASAVNSAMEMLEEQICFGNESLVVEVCDSERNLQRSELRCLVDDNAQFRIQFT